MLADGISSPTLSTLCQPCLNTNRRGGGLYQNNATGTLVYATVANNTAPFGAGIYKNGSGTGYLYVNDTALSNNTGGNCGGVITSQGYNLSSDNSCGAFIQTGDQNNKNAKLGPLANNGGPTQTHKPLEKSPLINKGTPNSLDSYDQRGISRPQRGKVDIGSVKVQ